MCVYIAIIATSTILAVKMWCVGSAAGLEHNGYELESSLAGHFHNGSVYWKGPGM